MSYPHTLRPQSTLCENLAFAREAEHLGDYDLAARLLGDCWRGIDSHPYLDGIESRELCAEVLLRAGALTGYLGCSAQNGGAQERAKDLLTLAHDEFTALGLRERVAEARIELATCYRRLGAFDESRAFLDSADELLGASGDKLLLALCAVRRIITELSAGELEAAAATSIRASEFVRACGSEALRGRFHNEYGGILFFLSEAGKAARYSEAVTEFSAARACFARAGHLRYCASSTNNTALALLRLGRVVESLRQSAEARRLALCVGDLRLLAEIDDTQAQALVEQDRLVEAEAVARVRLDELGDTDHGALLADNLTTYATILARLGRTREAEAHFERAIDIADACGDRRGAECAKATRASEVDNKTVLPFRASHTRKGRLTFEWRMSDDALRDIGIRKGDAVRFVVAEKFSDGNLVAALTPDGRIAMLIYFAESNTFRLEGAHPRCKPRVYRRDELTVLGVAVT